MKIVIVGGGTAGWFTALYAKKFLSDHEIILIESEKIGILGVGEASTPHMIESLNILNIPVYEIIKNTGATIKMTVKFSNWDKDNKYFYHPFAYIDPIISEQSYNFKDKKDLGISKSHIYAAKDGLEMSDYCFINKICDNNKVAFYSEKETFDINNFLQSGHWSLNFDASLLAKELKKIAEQRGVIVKSATVEKIISDDTNNISKIILSDGTEQKTDFIFDCSGFKRIIIGNFYKSQWISYSNFLPTNKALPFFLEKDKDIPPYIEAIAMNYGWMWKTPLQHRYGCGYVFDEKYISIDEAKEEVEKFLGIEISSPKIFSFSAGSFEKIWIKNCIAVGLSAGFIEPLESTSLMQSFNLLNSIFLNGKNILFKTEKFKDKINNEYLKESQEIMEYIYMHYFTNKNNNEFWKWFQEDKNIPDFVKYLLETIQERPLSQKIDFINNNKKTFDVDDYMYIFAGHKLLSKKIIDKHYEFINKDDRINYLQINQFQDSFSKKCINHKDFLLRIGQ